MAASTDLALRVLRLATKAASRLRRAALPARLPHATAAAALLVLLAASTLLATRPGSAGGNVGHARHRTGERRPYAGGYAPLPGDVIPGAALAPPGQAGSGTGGLQPALAPTIPSSVPASAILGIPTSPTPGSSQAPGEPGAAQMGPYSSAGGASPTTTAGPPAPVTVTASDSGKTVRLVPGQGLDVQLQGSAGYSWSAPATNNSGVLAQTSSGTGPSPGGASATFVARQDGQATVSATQSPVCAPACAMPDRRFSVTAVVES